MGLHLEGIWTGIEGIAAQGTWNHVLARTVKA
jgi:hypothetical protein